MDIKLGFGMGSVSLKNDLAGVGMVSKYAAIDNMANENSHAQKEDKLFDVKLTEDEVDQCVHSINELSNGQPRGMSLQEQARVQSGLSPATELNAQKQREGLLK